MHPQKSADFRSEPVRLIQSVSGLYLAVGAVLLFVIAILTVNNMALSSRLGLQAPAAAPQAASSIDTAERAALYAKLAKLADELSAEAAERNRLAARLDELLALRDELNLKAGAGEGATGAAGSGGAAVTSPDADPRAALLRAIEDTERELAAVSQALEVVEQRISAQHADVAGLGTRLNRALLAKVEELQQGRSDFFSRLRTVLGDRPDFRIEGDRFALPSEILFAPGSDRLVPEGVEEVRRLAATINAVRKEFPADINWVLRVGGHTDKRPIASSRFPSNWELSALRAVTVAKLLIAEGVPPQHVAAAGFGEFQPVTTLDTDAALARNRRIEFRLDQP